MQTKLIITRLRLTAVQMLFLGAFVAVGFSACSKNSEPLSAEPQVAIAPTAILEQGAIEATSSRLQTRTPVDGSQGLTLYFARADKTTASGAYESYGATALTATRTAGSGATALTLSPAQHYRTDGLETKLTGWYPAATSFAGGVVSWSLDGSQDIMTAGNQEGTKTLPMPNFVFNHRLAQLQFFPYAEEERISQGWGKITKIEVLAQADNATYTLSTEAIAFSGSKALSAGVAAAGVALPASKLAATMMGSAVMIAPQNSDSYTLTLEITTEHKGVKTVTLTRKFEAGIPYKIYLRFVDLEMIITPEVAITEWTGKDINIEY